MGWTLSPTSLSCASTTLNGIPDGIIRFWFGDADDDGFVAFADRAGTWIICAGLYPEIGGMSATSFEVNGNPFWHNADGAMFYSDGGDTWYYMPDGIYPGYLPNDDDIYYTVTMPADLSAVDEVDLTATAAGSASGDITLLLSWPSEVWRNSSGQLGIYESTTDGSKRFFGVREYSTAGNTFYLDDYLIPYSVGTLNLVRDGSAWKVIEPDTDKIWQSDSLPDPGSDWTFAYTGSDSATADITLTWSGWVLNGDPEAKSSRLYTAEVVTWH